MTAEYTDFVSGLLNFLEGSGTNKKTIEYIKTNPDNILTDVLTESVKEGRSKLDILKKWYHIILQKNAYSQIHKTVNDLGIIVDTTCNFTERRDLDKEYEQMMKVFDHYYNEGNNEIDRFAAKSIIIDKCKNLEDLVTIRKIIIN
jgi:hypothetical protein